MYTFDDSNGYVQTGVVGTLQPNTEDIIFLNSGTAWAVANGRLYSYDVAADGTFSNAQDLGEINPGQTDIVGLQLLETGVVVALEASGEGHSTADISGGPPTWTATGYTVAHSGAVTGAAAYQDQGFGYAGNDLLYGGDGNDTIFVGEGNDSAYGGEGDDYIDDRDEANTSGDNLMDGGAGNDTIFGGDGNSTIYGGTGNDLLIGEGGADLFINADAFGNDTVVGGETAGTSTDDDTLSFEDMTLSGIDITLSGGEAGTATSGADTITFSEIEAYRLTNQNDTLDGSGSADVVRGEGLAGDDLMLGGSNADSLDGGAGNDTLQGGAGNDTLIGGTGDDTLTGDTGNDSIDGGLDNDSIAGGDGDDTLLGNDGDDTISGGLGADSIDGGSGADVINAGSGDTVASGDGDDVINVSAADLDGGNLTVVGGEGGETLGDTLNITGPATINMTGAESGTVTWLDGSVLTFSEIETINYVPCFTPGVLIKTKRGEVDAAEIAVGDEVLTRDNGYQPVRWIGSRGLTHRQIAREESLRPVMIRAGSIAPGWPERDLLVSPQHRVVLSGAQVQLVFGAEEALAAAVHLTRRNGIEQISPKGGVTYIHFMFDRHELVMSNGVWTESFQPGAMSLVGLDSPQRNELFRLFPELLHSHGRSGFPAARPMLKAHQAQVLAAF
jgi:Ca2+-binding RTX toxin-like protein